MSAKINIYITQTKFSVLKMPMPAQLASCQVLSGTMLGIDAGAYLPVNFLIGIQCVLPVAV